MVKPMLALSAMLMSAAALSAAAATAAAQASEPSVQVQPAHLQVPRPLAEQTEKAVIRDYLRSWKAMSAALEQNAPGRLNADFIGTAKDKLTETIHEQAAAGIHTRYDDQSHNVQIVFYSPDGLSVELVDNVEYEMRIFDHDHLVTTHPEQARYIVLLTPAEVSWRVRVLQTE